MLGRAIGLSFLLPFLFFLMRGWIEPGMHVRLWSFFGAIVFIGVVGWWMVRSGLSHRISVSQYRLAFHLTFASAIFAAILWTAQSLARRAAEPAPPRLRRSALALAVMVLFQIYLGALVAGLDAGLVFNTWPLIDGSLIPSAERLWFESPAWRNLFDNTLMVQFEHRMFAYILWLAAVWHAVDFIRARVGGAALTGALALAGLVTVQAAIGILTLLHQAPFALASLHQLTGIAVLTVAVIHAERLWSQRPTSQDARAPLSGASVPRGTT
jgi:cytochrome c oxidase assembly protein subunit 15